MLKEKDGTVPGAEEPNAEKAKKRPAFSPAEIIALVVAAVLMAVAGFLAVYKNTQGKIILEPNTSTVESIATDSVVNINTADRNELMTLNGIGETLADRIVDYRLNHGDFASVWDLEKVAGISRNMVNNLFPYITV